MPATKMNLIACVDANMGIGKANTLPWHLRKDFEVFVKLTSETVDPTKQNVVIMGRKCYESIPKKFRPLKNRINFVLSRTIKSFEGEPEVKVCASLEEVFGQLAQPSLAGTYESIWNIGGRDIYALGLRSPYLHRIYLTRLQKSFDCDVSFPEFDQEDCVLVTDDRLPTGVITEKDIPFTFQVYEYKRKTNLN